MEVASLTRRLWASVECTQWGIWLINLSSGVIKFSKMLAECYTKQGNYSVIRAAFSRPSSPPSSSLLLSSPSPLWASASLLGCLVLILPLPALLD